MGREATRGTSEPVDAGVEAFKLSVAVGMSPEDALRSAINAGINAACWSTLEAVRDDLLDAAELLDASESDVAEDGPAALILYAMNIDDVLPPERRKEQV